MPFYHRARRPLPQKPLRQPPTRPRQAGGQLDASRVGYAVVDLETTGLSPAADSIIEIGLVLASPDGSVERSWTTLVDPGAGIDVGPTHIHGLVGEDLVGAPALADVADLLVRDLAGRAVVAHNARFDVGFLTQALSGLEHLARGARVPRVCTMETARHFMDTPSRRLVTCCETAGITIGQHHTALDDALASAGLLRHYLAVGRERGEEPVMWSRALEEAAVFTGWRWSEAAARAQEARLVPRPGDGVLR
ncbi:3'-5' exonuclease [Actinomyces sp. MRS3W]|uniref:3'-5' exonuclease n=1 Tax=Actinomyces sp. MRS3W TaxID=2800796 RepID=UPI0028FD1B58|nr:3'-5' exonuclease [Actinomyces sp. MRS3W]MDU0348490.1 3'-5' exonuclease [Actinomyces sp. MRS3W]